MYMWGSVYVTACICGFARAFGGIAYVHVNGGGHTARCA